MATGMIIDGVLGSEAIDSSGEILDVEGADISDVEKGTLLLNWEHEPGEKGASTLVGKVVAAKKIFNKDDCENDRQRMYWDQVKLPFIYGVCRLYDGAGHEEAKRIAAIVRDHVANDELVVCRFSVEGSTLEKEGNRLKASVIRRVAVTVKPCNRTATSGLIEDPNAPDGFEKKIAKEKVKDLLDFEGAIKGEDPMFVRLGGGTDIECNPLVEDALEKAALEAGFAGGAPGSLTGGAALQREDAGLRKRAVKALQEFGDRDTFDKAEFRAFMKTKLPDASDEFLDHFEDIGEDYHVKRGQLRKKEAAVKAKSAKAKAPAKTTAPKKTAAPAAKPKAAPAAAPAEEGDEIVKIKQGTIRGVPVTPNAMKGYQFDEAKGILHTPKGSFPLYNPDKGFESVTHKAAKAGPFYKDGKLHVGPGADSTQIPANPANPTFREIYNSKPIEDFHSGIVMPKWVRLHELVKANKLPEEVVMHSAVFSMLSPNTPVRPHELMHSHMVDTWEDLGIDPRDPDFIKARSHWLGKDKPQNYPRNAGDYFRKHPDIHLKAASEEKGRQVGDLKSFMLGPNKFKNIAQYSKLHPTLLNLLAKHGTNGRAAAAELMQLKVKENQWKAQRQLYRTKVRKKAFEELGLRNTASDYVKQKTDEATAAGLMGKRKMQREPGDDDDEQMSWDPRMLPDNGDPLGDMSIYYGSPQRAQTKGDTAKRANFQQEAEALGHRDDLNEYAEGETKKQFKQYPGVPVPGLAPKTGRFTFSMMGAGNSFVPDTHMVRHLFGMDPAQDGPTLAYLKNNVLWNPKNHHVLEAMDRWYAKNHPAAQLMQQHPLWGKHFQDDPEQANFPGFWRHWCSIAEDERRRGIANEAENEFSTHEPFFQGIEHLVKHEGGSMDHNVMARLMALHLQYREDNGEVPAQMMYYAHIVPHLIEANQFRTKHDDLEDFIKSAKSYGLMIDLRKATDDVEMARLSDPKVPTIHSVNLQINGKEHKAGRFALSGGKIHHLEDYYGMLQRYIPEGPFTSQVASRIHALKMSPYIKIGVDEIPPDKYEQAGEPPLAAPAQATPARPPSVFEYHRVGMDKPHTLEVKSGQYMLDGNRLTHPEVSTIMDNLHTYAASIRYKKSNQTVEAIRKMESAFNTILKSADEDAPEIDEDALLQHARAAEAAGHLPKGFSKNYTRHLYEDPATPGMGNKKAWQNFAAKQKPGAYIQMDGNDFKHVNDAFGHEGGDAAIKAFGKAARSAMNETVGDTHGKLFRNGGDEFIAHVPSHEHAASFARSLSQKLNDMAPIEGRHKLSMSFGFGHTPQVADKALYAAKTQKLGANGQRAYPVGQVPNLAHSFMPGHEGAIPVHQPDLAVHQKVMSPPAELPTPSAAAVPSAPDPAKAKVELAPAA